MDLHREKSRLHFLVGYDSKSDRALPVGETSADHAYSLYPKDVMQAPA